MKTITATELKNNTGDFFDALLQDGEINISRNGKNFPIKFTPEKSEEVRTENVNSLIQAMKRMGEEARKNGMTPEELKEIVGMDDTEYENIFGKSAVEAKG